MKGKKVLALVFACMMGVSMTALSSCEIIEGFLNPPISSSKPNSSSSSNKPNSSSSSTTPNSSSTVKPDDSSSTVKPDDSSSSSSEPEEVTVKTLTVTKEPTKMTYKLGDTLDPTGMEVSVTMTDGSIKKVTDYTVEPSNPLTVNDTALKVTYTEEGKTVVGYCAKKILIEADELRPTAYSGKTELLFSDSTNYTLGGGATKSTWNSDGNTFNRLRCNKDVNKTIEFEHDFSTLEDKSKAGFRAIMSIARGGSKVEISVDEGETWEVVSAAGEGLNTLPADYKYPSSTIDGKTATDGQNRNVFYAYWNIGKYMSETTKKVRIRFSYEDPTGTGWVGPDVEGSDLMHSVAFFDKLDLTNAGKPVTLTNVALQKAPTKTTYFEGEAFDATGLELLATYSDGTTQTITTGITIPTEALTASMNSVTVSYEGFEITIDIEVNEPVATLVSISVTTLPTKVTYEVGEMFDPTGMVVTATYSDNTTIAVTGYTYKMDALAVSDKMITITYEGKTAEVSVTVTKPKQTALTEADYDVAAELLFTDSSNYKLVGGARNSNQARKFADGTSAERLRCDRKVGAYIQFEYDFGEDKDLTQAGFMFYGLHTRGGTYVEVSTDGTNFERIASVSATDKKITADWKEHCENIVQGNPAKADDNMYAMYYNVTMNGATKLYVRIGYEAPTISVTDNEGADIFGSITFYSRLDLTVVK